MELLTEDVIFDAFFDGLFKMEVQCREYCANSSITLYVMIKRSGSDGNETHVLTKICDTDIRSIV